MARIVALLVASLLAAAPAASLGAVQRQSPQNQIGEPVQTQAPQQTSTDDGSIGAFEFLLAGVGIVALIGGIWIVISRDARRATGGRAPAPDTASGASPTRASRRSRRLSAAERRRRKRGRAAK